MLTLHLRCLREPWIRSGVSWYDMASFTLGFHLQESILEKYKLKKYSTNKTVVIVSFLSDLIVSMVRKVLIIKNLKCF